MAQMELSRCNGGSSSAMPLEILGDCAQATQNYRRAVSCFRRAALLSGDAGRLRWKEAQCLSEMGNLVEAASILESVPHRTVGMSMTLGHLHVASGRQHDAIGAFLEALRSNAYALEAVEWLAALGADRTVMIDAVEQGLSRKRGHDILPAIELVSAHYLMHRNQASSALNSFIKLEEKFPNSIYLLLKIAALQVRKVPCMCGDAVVFFHLSCNPLYRIDLPIYGLLTTRLQPCCVDCSSSFSSSFGMLVLSLVRWGHGKR